MDEKYPEKERSRRELAARIDHAIARRDLSRRELLRRSGLVLLSASAVPALLAACGGDDGGEAAATTAAPATTAEAATTEDAAGTVELEVGGNLDFLSWEGYDLPDIMTGWLDANGVTLNPSYPANHDEITAKLAAGQGGFDIFTYYQGYKPLYSEMGVLQPLDEAKIPNLSGLIPFFATDVGNYWVDADGTRTGLPWTFSINSVNYDSSQVEAPTSYYDLLEPDFKGRVVVVDDPLGAFTIGAFILGYDVTTLTSDQQTEVSDLLKQFVGQARALAPTYGDGTSQLVSGDAAFIWPGWAAINSFAVQAGKDTVQLAIPEEGGMATTDAWAIPPDADNPDTAYAWMNETISPEINAEAAAYLVGGTVVTESVPLLTPEAAAVYPYYDDIEGLFEQVTLYGIPPQESDEYMTAAKMAELWAEIKA
jgi:spermidine/putrescine transport system substrate-binding protein